MLAKWKPRKAEVLAKFYFIFCILTGFLVQATETEESFKWFIPEIMTWQKALFSLSIALHLTHIMQNCKDQTVFNNQRVSDCFASQLTAAA